MSELNLSSEENDQKSNEYRQAEIDYALTAQAKSGANWFYWIAGLSLINSVIFLFGGNWSFFAGLGITQIIDAIVAQGAEIGDVSSIKIIAFVIDAIIAGIFILCGLWANKLQTWAFVAGMILYLLDGILVLILGAYLPAAFHAFALYMIFKGLSAARQIKATQIPATQ